MSAVYVPSQLAELSGSITTANISDFAEGVDDRVNSLLVAGTGITLTYNDAAGTMTVASPIGPTLDLNTTSGAAGTINATSHATKGVLNFNGGLVNIGADGSINSTGPLIDLFRTSGARLIFRATLDEASFELRPKDPGWSALKMYRSNGTHDHSITGSPSGDLYFQTMISGNPIHFTIAALPVIKITTAEALLVTPPAATSFGAVIKGFASQSANLQEWRSSAAAVYGTVSENGYWTTRKTAAPADGELIAGEAAFWLDSTAGSAKFMIKAKNASGTVVTGSITLT